MTSTDTTDTPIAEVEESEAERIGRMTEAAAAEMATGPVGEPALPPDATPLGLSLSLAIMGYQEAKRQLYEIANLATSVPQALVDDCLNAARGQAAQAALVPSREADDLADQVDVEIKIYRAISKLKQELAEIAERAQARQALRGGPTT